MREISGKKITEAVAQLCVDSNINLDESIVKLFLSLKEKEESHEGKIVFDELIENARVAKEKKVPICQDTGMTVVFVEKGADLYISGSTLAEAVNKGVKKGYTKGFLRASVVDGPFTRKNTGDNTPAVLHLEEIKGEKIKITVVPKGGGSENMSALKMLKPSEGEEGIKNFVRQTVENAGANPCPPIMVGVGIGGNFEKAPLLAKKALLRDIGAANRNKKIAAFEDELLKIVNSTGIGPAGYGGRITAFQVNVETAPCHIASLPVAVNIQCHAARHKSIIL